MKKNYRSWIAVILVFVIVAGCSIYGFRWINKREGDLVPSNRTLGIDFSVYVGVDKEFVDSALEREDVTYMDLTGADEKARGISRYAVHEQIQGLNFATTLYFATKVQTLKSEEEEESSSSSSLIPDIKLKDQKSTTRTICTGYEKIWTGTSGELDAAQKEAVNTIYQALVKKYGVLKKDNGATYAYDTANAAYPVTELPEAMQQPFKDNDITNEVFGSFTGVWVKTINKSSLMDDGVIFSWGKDPESGNMTIRIAQYTSEDFPYASNEEEED